MRIEQEKIPSAEELYNNYNMSSKNGFSTAIKLADDYLNFHLKTIRCEYDQYQFFLDGYRDGSASISEVTAAHDRFLKLLEV